MKELTVMKYVQVALGGDWESSGNRPGHVGRHPCISVLHPLSLCVHRGACFTGECVRGLAFLF